MDASFEESRQIREAALKVHAEVSTVTASKTQFMLDL